MNISLNYQIWYMLNGLCIKLGMCKENESWTYMLHVQKAQKAQEAKEAHEDQEAQKPKQLITDKRSSIWIFGLMLIDRYLSIG